MNSMISSCIIPSVMDILHRRYLYLQEKHSVRNILTKKEWLIFGCTCISLVVVQTISFFVSQRVHTALDFACFALLAVGMLYFIVREIKALKSGDSESPFCLSVAGFSWVIVAMYMNSGIFYMIALSVNALMMILLLLSLRKEVMSS